MLHSMCFGPAPRWRGAAWPVVAAVLTLDDPRANRARRTLESMIAGTMVGDDRLSEEMLGDGRVRYRRGSDCIMVQPARSAQLDPFNQSTSQTPRLVSEC